MSDATKIIIADVLFSYVTVFEPKAAKDGAAEKYSVSLIISKDDTDTIDKINAAVQAAIGKGVNSSKFTKSDAGKSSFKLPLRDGDTDRAEFEEYENTYFLTASSSRKPKIFNAADRMAITDPDEFYSGCTGKAQVNFYAFNASGNKGIACGLNMLLKEADGDALDGSGGNVNDFFDDDGNADDIL